jgi:hypothetical protein
LNTIPCASIPAFFYFKATALNKYAAFAALNWMMPLRRRKTQNSKPKTLPGGSVVVFGVRPRGFGVGPGLSVLVFLERFSDLIPSMIVVGSVIATIQSERGEAKNGNKETSHR